MELKEKFAYLKGMAAMADLDPASKESRLLSAMMDFFEEVTGTVTGLVKSNTEMCNLFETFDTDLDRVEKAIAELADDEEDDDEDDEEEEYDEDEDGDLYEAQCPTCGQTVYINEEMLDEGETVCPGCGEVLEFDFGIGDFNENKDSSEENAEEDEDK